MIIHLGMIARAQLIRAKDNELVAARTCSAESFTYKWSEWVEMEGCDDESGRCVIKEGEHFHKEVETNYRSLAEQIVTALGLEEGYFRCRK